MRLRVAAMAFAYQGDGMRQRLHDVLDFWRFLLQRFLADRGISSAAALTYTTLFAVVPMMTVTFAMLSAVPAFQGVGEHCDHPFGDPDRLRHRWRGSLKRVVVHVCLHFACDNKCGRNS